MRLLLLTIALVAALAPAARGQALSELPGYVDFGDLAELGGREPVVEVSLGSALLGFLAAAAREEEPEFAATLAGLRSIRLNVFELDDRGVEAARARAREIIDRLEADAWEPAVSVRSADSNVYLYMKMKDTRVAGMTVLTVDAGGEAVFMNIVGEIDPEQLGRVAAQFGVDFDGFGER